MSNPGKHMIAKDLTRVRGMWVWTCLPSESKGLVCLRSPSEWPHVTVKIYISACYKLFPVFVQLVAAVLRICLWSFYLFREAVHKQP